MKLFKYSSFSFFAIAFFSCKTLTEGSVDQKQTKESASQEAYSTASSGSTNGESRAKDTPSVNNKAIHHAASDQARIDSIKQAKTSKKN